MTKDEIILEYEKISSDTFKKYKKKLEAELEIALKNEDYTLAAQLRDMIND
jgi:DNA-directed RNA polymerase subunit L